MGHANDNIFTVAYGSNHEKFSSSVCTCVNLVVIPNGMSRQLQPLDIKQLKDHSRKEYQSWLLSENNLLTPSGKLEKKTS